MRPSIVLDMMGWHLALWSAVYQDVLSARKETQGGPEFVSGG